MIVGMGEMGGVLARGLLREGCTVHPVTRETDVRELAARVPQPERVIVAVGEDALDGVLRTLPGGWRGRVVLLQNELLPRVWEQVRLTWPTVLVAWFEKKPAKEVTVILPSPVWGRGAELITRALGRVGIPTCVIESHAEIVFELVRKNLYILVGNLAGLTLPESATVGELWREHADVAGEVFDEVLAVQAALVGESLPRERLRAGLEEAIDADPAHRARGRTASARLRRAIEQAKEHGVPVPRLEAIARSIG